MSSPSPLTKKSLSLILAYAPAGLGHLRVTDALRHGLPEGADPILFLSGEGSVKFLHQITSSNPILRRMFEWFQYGKQEEIQTRFLRKILLRDAKDVEEKLFTIYKQQVDLPDTMVIVATHFGVAHQVAAIKKRFEAKANLKLILVVVVTDDSPQRIWYVPGADLLVVPSEQTKESLISYAKREGLADSRVEVLPYPLSIHLGKNLSSDEYRARKLELDPTQQSVINVSVPISGAAVGTLFANDLMRKLHRRSKRFVFHVVAKKTIYTELFLQLISKLTYVEIFSSHSDRQIVELYEQAYTQTVMALEITKPSEQSFKSMFTPKQIGGVIMLFTTPVGRQEYDNLQFMQRHSLLPTETDQHLLFELAAGHVHPHEVMVELLVRARDWRGIKLPVLASEAATFVMWCYEAGIFSAMYTSEVCPTGDNRCAHEVGSTGVVQFWKQVEHLLEG